MEAYLDVTPGFYGSGEELHVVKAAGPVHVHRSENSVDLLAAHPVLAEHLRQRRQQGSTNKIKKNT